MNNQEQFLSFVQNEKGQIDEAFESGEKPSEKASQLLDAALDEWAQKNEGKSKEECSWLKDGREFIAELEAIEKGELDDLDARNEKLREIAKNISTAARKELMAELPKAEEAPKDLSPEQMAFNEALADFPNNPFSGIFKLLSTGAALLMSKFRNIWPFGKKEEKPEAEEEVTQAESKEAPTEIIDYPELQINLPSNAILTSDIQSHREVTGRPHNGVDIAGMPEGTPLYAPGVGKVLDVGTHKGFGNYVRIEYKIGGKFYQFRFNHLAEKSALKEGALVSEGVELGKVGHSGFVIPGNGGNGDHLHFEVYDSKKELVDPIQFLPKRYQQTLMSQREDSGINDPRWEHDHESASA